MLGLPLMKASSLGLWYTDAAELETNVGEGKNKKLEVENVEWKDLVEKKRKLGERLLTQYTQDYESSRGQPGDIEMSSATQESGTMVDDVSAISFLVGENPIANLKSFDKLLGLVTSESGIIVFQALKDLFISSLLPDRKLKDLSQQPLNNLPESEDGYSLLLFWYWEECLKLRYGHFICALEETSRDVSPKLKDEALKTMYELLRYKPEQERRLLTVLVNKLGDSANEAASSGIYHLTNLLSDHPNMTAVVIHKVDSFLFRPHLELQAKYRAVNFLSNIHLSNKGDGPKVAKCLINVYFSLFKVLILEVYAGRKMDESCKSGNGKDSSSFKDSEVKSPSDSHVELDPHLLSALLEGANRAFPFVSTGVADDTIELLVPMLFQLLHSKNFSIGVLSLMLLDKISSKSQIVSDLFYRTMYSKLILPSIMSISKVKMFIGLVGRASDINLKRAAAYSKRLLQVALHEPAEYACACLLLVSEVVKAHPSLWNMVLQKDEDVRDFEEETDEKPKSDDGIAGSSNNIADRTSKTKPLLPGGYNPRGRDSCSCNADGVGWWELVVLASHAHPSVAKMAKTLLSGVNIVYNENPLDDLSLDIFFDKFNKLDMKNHEILPLAEGEVPPEDNTFRKFCMNKTSSSKKLKKKKNELPKGKAKADMKKRLLAAPEDTAVFHKLSSSSPKKPKGDLVGDVGYKEEDTMDRGQEGFNYEDGPSAQRKRKRAFAQGSNITLCRAKK